MNTIGFNAKNEEYTTDTQLATTGEVKAPRQSVVQVYFPHRGTGWSYYNDSFDLKVGDYVYVEGKLEGYRGQVTEVNYSFKIKLSDYKRVIAVADTTVKGDLYPAGSHFVGFDRSTIPFSKVVTWFRPPEKDEDYVTSNDSSKSFLLADLLGSGYFDGLAAEGKNYYLDYDVEYLELDGPRGRAIVDGREYYVVEFDYNDGEVSNLKCQCFAGGACKHEFVALYKLKETLDYIDQNHSDKYKGYFAAIDKHSLWDTAMKKKASGKITLEV